MFWIIGGVLVAIAYKWRGNGWWASIFKGFATVFVTVIALRVVAYLLAIASGA